MRRATSTTLHLITLMLILSTLNHTRIAAAGPQANLSLVVQGPSGPVVAGAQAQYTATITNQGPAQAINVSTVLTLPSSITFVAITSAATCEHGADMATCTLPMLDLNASATIVLTVAVTPDARGAFPVHAVVRSNIADPDQNNNSRSVMTAVQPEIDLQVEHIGDTATPATAGAPLIYQLRVSNSGRSTATKVLLHVTLPPDRIERFLSASPGYNCTGTPATVTCSIGTVAPAGMAASDWVTSGTVITMEVQPKASLLHTDTLFDAAFVDGEEAETVTGNNFSYQMIGVDRVSDLGVIIEPSSEQVPSGREVAYTFVTTNHGPSEHAGVVLTSTFSADVLDIQEVTGKGCGLATGEVSCDLGTLAPGQVVRVTLYGRVRATQPTPLKLTVQIHGNDKEPAEARANSALRSVHIQPHVVWLPCMFGST